MALSTNLILTWLVLRNSILSTSHPRTHRHRAGKQAAANRIPAKQHIHKPKGLNEESCLSIQSQMAGSNPQGKSDAELPRTRNHESYNVANPFINFDEILVNTPDQLLYEDPGDAGKELKGGKTKRRAFKRAILGVIAKIRKDKGKGKARGD